MGFRGLAVTWVLLIAFSSNLALGSDIRIQNTRNENLRCALCHEEFNEDFEKETRVQCTCGSALHEECLTENGKCPTLGCQKVRFPAAPLGAARTYNTRRVFDYSTRPVHNINSSQNSSGYMGTGVDRDRDRVFFFGTLTFLLSVAITSGIVGRIVGHLASPQAPPPKEKVTAPLEEKD